MTAGSQQDLPSHTGRGSAHPGLPFSAVLGVFVGLAVLVLARTELRDVDLYWHLLAGAELADGVPPADIGLDWSYAPIGTPWTSTQWLFELLLHYSWQAADWPAIAGIRVVTGALALALLALTTVRGLPIMLAALPFATAGAAVVFVSQERPQQATLVGAILLGGVLVRGLRAGTLPTWYLLLPATVVWANLHGGWVLVPMVLGLIAAGQFLDHGMRNRAGWGAAGLAALSVLAGAFTPSGLAGLTAPLRFSAATDLIREWQPTQPTYGLGTLTVAMLLLIVVGWARSSRVARSELLAVTVLLVFTWSAWRNVAPGLVLLAPIASRRLADAFPASGRSEPRWSRPVGITLAGGLSLVAVFALVGQQHLPYSSKPVTLAMEIADLPAGQRVLNDYNAAGLVLFFGGPGTQVGIDGRADRYGAEYIESYLRLSDLQGEWAHLLSTLDPTTALIEEDSALAYELRDIRGWEQVGSENGFVLLVRGQ